MKQKILLLAFAIICLFQLDATAQRNNRNDRNDRDNKSRYDQRDRNQREHRYWNRTRDYNEERDRYYDDYDRRTYSCRPMGNDAFFDAMNTIKNTSFDNTKLEIANSITAMNCMTTDQIMTIAQNFSFESNRLAYAKKAYAACADPQNYFKILNTFTFSSSKEELSQYIGNRR